MIAKLPANMHSQRGLSLLGTLIVGAFVAFCLFLAFRTVPAINEYMAIKRVISVLADEGDNGVSVPQLRRSFDRYAYADNIASISGVDLLITHQGGVTEVSVDYERVVPVAGNVSLLLEFTPSSARN